MAKITILGDNGELKTISGSFSKICETTSSYADEQRFVDAVLNSKNTRYKKVYFVDSLGSVRIPIYGKDIKKINQALKNQGFIRNHLQECPMIFSGFVRANLKTNYNFYINNIYKSMVTELNNLREKNIDNYYSFLIELMKCYNKYLEKMNEPKEHTDYSEYVKAAYDNIKLENKIKFGQKEENENKIEQKEENEIKFEQKEEKDDHEDYLEENEKYEIDDPMYNLYSFFRSDHIDDMVPLKTIIISNDFDAKKKLCSILDKCNVDFENPFSKYNEADFIILIGNDIKSDIKNFINYRKPILAISLDKNIRVDDNVVTLINGFDEEAIVNYLIVMQQDLNKVRHYE